MQKVWNEPACIENAHVFLLQHSQIVAVVAVVAAVCHAATATAGVGVGGDTIVLQAIAVSIPFETATTFTFTVTSTSTVFVVVSVIVLVRVNHELAVFNASKPRDQLPEIVSSTFPQIVVRIRIRIRIRISIPESTTRAEHLQQRHNDRMVNLERFECLQSLWQTIALQQRGWWWTALELGRADGRPRGWVK